MTLGFPKVTKKVFFLPIPMVPLSSGVICKKKMIYVTLYLGARLRCWVLMLLENVFFWGRKRRSFLEYGIIFLIASYKINHNPKKYVFDISLNFRMLHLWIASLF